MHAFTKKISAKFLVTVETGQVILESHDGHMALGNNTMFYLENLLPYRDFDDYSVEVSESCSYSAPIGYNVHEITYY